MTEEKIIDSFHAMWNNYPGMVRLIKKDRTVIAVNTASVKAGLTTGVKCFEIGPAEGHAGCLANKALSEKTGLTQLSPDGKLVRYWIPVDGCEDVYVHFVLFVDGIIPPVAE